MVLGNSYLIVVPTTLYNKIAPADLVDGVRSEVKRALASAFGGYTETEGVGGYIAEGGELIEETVYQITAWAGRRDDDVVRDLARMIKERLAQESVFVRINGEAYIE